MWVSDTDCISWHAGKTTFIKHLLQRDYPGIHIGPEPTTDRQGFQRQEHVPAFTASVTAAAATAAGAAVAWCMGLPVDSNHETIGLSPHSRQARMINSMGLACGAATLADAPCDDG